MKNLFHFLSLFLLTVFFIQFKNLYAGIPWQINIFFQDTGRLYLPLDSGSLQFNQRLCSTPDGEYLLANAAICRDVSFTLYKFDINGFPVTSFGHQGVHAYHVPGSAVHTLNECSIIKMYVLNTGEILICGLAGNDSISPDRIPFLAKLLADGSPDTSFQGNGFRLFPDRANGDFSFEVLSNGKILCLSAKGSVGRLLPDGNEDLTFGNNGILYTLFAGDTAACMFAQELPTGKVILALETQDIQYRIATMRIDTAGAIDPGYGINGYCSITCTYPGYNSSSLKLRSMVIHQNNFVNDTGIFILGDIYRINAPQSSNPVVFKLHSSGILDGIFGNGLGQVLYPITDSTESWQGYALKDLASRFMLCMNIQNTGNGNREIAFLEFTEYGSMFWIRTSRSSMYKLPLEQVYISDYVKMFGTILMAGIQFQSDSTALNQVCPLNFSDYVQSLLVKVIIEHPGATDRDLSQNTIRIFPNPASEMFYLYSEQGYESLSPEIMDVQGRQIPFTSEPEGNLLCIRLKQRLAPGIYYLRTQSGQGYSFILE